MRLIDYTNKSGFSFIRWVMTNKLVSIMIIVTCLLLVSGCVYFRPRSPIKYKPNYDISPIMALKFPERIDTLPGFPKTEIIVENGISPSTGDKHKDIKEWFNLRLDQTKYEYLVEWSEYMIIICYNEEKAKKEYECWKQFVPVFREITENGITTCIHYTKQPRADPEGGSVPMGYYISQADFLIHNLYIRVKTRDNSPKSDKLSDAIKELARMLSESLNLNNSLSTTNSLK